jgi:hypothetical protein
MFQLVNSAATKVAPVDVSGHSIGRVRKVALVVSTGTGRSLGSAGRDGLKRVLSPCLVRFRPSGGVR